MITTEITELLYKRAMFIVKDSHAAEDIVQQCLVKLTKQIADRPDMTENHIRMWLYIVVRNQSLKYLRSRKNFIVVDPIEFNDNVDDAPSPYQVIDNIEQSSIMGERLKRVLKLLPERQQLLLKLQYEDKMSYRDISKVTGLTPGNIGFLINKSMKVLRSKIEVN